MGYLHAMFLGSEAQEISNEVLRLLNSHFVWLSLLLAALGLTPMMKNLSLKLMRKNKIFIVVFDLFLLATFIFTLLRLSAATHNPFIYFQF
jgi:hypothetical protein